MKENVQQEGEKKRKEVVVKKEGNEKVDEVGKKKTSVEDRQQEMRQWFRYF